MVEHYKWKLPSLATPRIVLDILQNAKAERRRPAIGQNTSRVWYSLCDRLALSKFWIYVQNGVESAVILKRRSASKKQIQFIFVNVQ